MTCTSENTPAACRTGTTGVPDGLGQTLGIACPVPSRHFPWRGPRPLVGLGHRLGGRSPPIPAPDLNLSARHLAGVPVDQTRNSVADPPRVKAIAELDARHPGTRLRVHLNFCEDCDEEDSLLMAAGLDTSRYGDSSHHQCSQRGHRLRANRERRRRGSRYRRSGSECVRKPGPAGDLVSTSTCSRSGRIDSRTNPNRRRRTRACHWSPAPRGGAQVLRGDSRWAIVVLCREYRPGRSMGLWELPQPSRRFAQDGLRAESSDGRCGNPVAI